MKKTYLVFVNETFVAIFKKVLLETWED